MTTYQTKDVVYYGLLQPAPKRAWATEAPVGLELCRHPQQPPRYSILSQSREELDNPENTPAISMWPYLIASDQTKRLNEISIYSEKGTTSDKLRFLYLNDFALSIWDEMNKHIQVMGRLHRPPRCAVLSFGMPFSD
ncbi:hypothetical protein [Terriglobus sp. TAA 43]|uniref:hypothetical protein n=1 Tax=Terriglobus sp. TAA 43 TaxID=278961 RepID=UPI00068F713C|nr:hypothetical protein [Terriglobus sp. TAA 43]